MMPGCGCGGDEGAVAGGGVAAPEEAPGAIHNVTAPMTQPPMCAGFAQRPQGEGIAAGPGSEVAAEAEHVRPPAQLQRREYPVVAKTPAGPDEPPDVRRHRVAVNFG